MTIDNYHADPENQPAAEDMHDQGGPPDDIDYRDADPDEIDYGVACVSPPGEAEALSMASWHLSCIADEQRVRDETVAVFKAEAQRQRDRLEMILRAIDNRIAWHSQPVEAMHAAILRANPKRKSINLPGGTSRITVGKVPKVVIEDAGRLLEWALDNADEIVRRTPEVLVSSLKGYADVVAAVDPESGEVLEPRRWLALDVDGVAIPGVRVDPPASTWSPRFDA